ncbi:MAG TPA: hypothetical protein VGN55_25910 [Xanthobacteraceae bacterium]|jgi:hypothetical protein
MRTRLLRFTLLAALAAFAGAATLPARTAAQEQPNPADAAPAPFAPNMGDMMSILIQPRHAKLALAGKAENWVLAGYVLKELQQGFGTIARTIPRWKALPVSELIDAALKQPFATIDLAIKAGDSRQFAESFDRITAGCNACHSTADQSFVVIKTPDASAFPNQEFEPGRR